MSAMPVLSDEGRRLEALWRYAILDTLPEQALDDLTALAAQICGTPIAMISLVDERRQWFKAKVGLEAKETPRDVSFCAHALRQPDLFTVADATQDERFAGNPFVTGEPCIRFYAGAPLLTPEGEALGTLCVIDRVPRTLAPAQAEALRVLGRQVMTHFELHRRTRALAERGRLLQAIFDAEPECVKLLGPDGSTRMMNRAGLEMIEAETFDAVEGHSLFPLVAPRHRAEVEALAARVFRGESGTLEFELIGLKGTSRRLEMHAAPLRDASGRITALVGVSRDITARWRAEAKGRREHAELQTILDAVPALVFYKDREGRFLRVNRALARLIGTPPEAFVGKTDAQMGLPDGDRYRRDDLRVMASGEPICHQEEALDTAAGIRWLLTDKVPHRDESGRIIGVIGFAVDITERHHAEQALQRSQADLQLSLEAARMGTWDWNITTGAVAWSARCLAIYGIPAGSEVSYERFLQAVHPEDRVRIDAALRRAVEECTVYDEEKRVVWPDGSHWTASRAQVYCDAAGQPIRMAGVTFDITERKLAEETLRASEANLARAQRIAHLGCWELTLATNRLHWSEENFRIFGISPSDFDATYEAFLALVHPEDRTRRDEAHRRAVTGEAKLDIEHRIVRPDGTVRWVHELGELERDADGQPVRLTGTVLDFTERKRIEARFRRLVDSNAQGVIFWNRKGEITGANDAFLRIVGYTRNDLEAGRIGWDVITPPEYADLDQRGLEEIEARGVCAPFEKEYVRKDGSRVPVLVGAAAFDDSPDEGVCFVLDLTERKELEQTFLRAQRLESIGTLAGGIAHDLNNALSPIILSLDLLALKFTDPDSQELLEVINSSARRGADMVRQVLMFARGIEGSRMEVQIQPLLREIEKIANDTFLKHIKVQTRIPDDLWTVLGDPTQLHQVLLNLCVNARDAMPNGGTLTLSAENRTLDAQYAGLSLDGRPGPYVFLQVTDSGSGISPEVMDRIFDPFFTTKELGKGTGLGLSTSLAIVKSHGGFIRASSEMGVGSRFKVYLPAQPELSGAAAPVRKVEMPRGNGELILVVDDEPSVREITRQTLETFGYRALLAADGVEALALYASRRSEIAAVLTDMMMPVMDGPATISVLRRMNPAVVIIGASGLSSGNASAQAASLGINHFLPKPYTAEALLNALRKILSREG